MLRNSLGGAAFAALAIFGFANGTLADVVASNADNGKTISVASGTPLMIDLTGKHGDGYYWRIDADLTPELILSGRTTHSVAVPGAPETTSFTFTTDQVGQVIFKASYLKPGAPIPAKSDITITVNVTPGMK
jgi:predicted secreted protein